jgi:hypothetical protein
MRLTTKWALTCIAALITALTGFINGFAFGASPLVSISDPVYGPNSLTWDTASNLQWLDWSLTTNKTVIEILAQTGPAGTYRGFRYATKSELITLYQHAGFQNIDDLDPFGRIPDFPIAQQFVDLFGLTQVYPSTFYTTYLSRAFLGPGSYPAPGFYVEAIVSYILPDHLGFVGANGGLADPVGVGGYAPETGSALVRVVPEPSSVALVCFALISGLTQRKRRG